MKKLFAVLGYPIGHSMSPIMLNDVLSYYEIDAHYHPFKVSPEELEIAIRGLKAIGISGFNVTIPHKSAIIPFLDSVDDLALSIGAVNTVVNDNGKLVGYNTDGYGFIKGLEPYISSFSDKKVLVIGAGGAARAIYFTMAKMKPLALDITNRTVIKATELIKACPFESNSRALSLDEAEVQLNEYDVVIQTTMIGMYPNVLETPISLKKLNNQALVCDIVYNPLETQFLKEARQKGATVQNGVEMFVYQGALAFEKWTGIFPDVKRMRENVLRQLEA
ncbi:shikimate dehydrogenase [Neobacillus sp. 179-C4.2 HS]|uniref:Shikimate dehydrogenase (NADP(+)) n=1 Tax=Neobacillus driksii TaxID=3035913 RepID=A0ABV4YLW9_9BACI|nr:shikimate dehydrogenase [Neobacillus sp. 179.-C4.2 HS]MDP5193158.1 shikimate dehydrogenase [Neobacillus sp. 179.-C4.2 HS]